MLAQYLSEIRNLHTTVKNIREEAYATADDKILTLSTCISGEREKRMLVAAKQVFAGGYDEVEAAEQVIARLTGGQ